MLEYLVEQPFPGVPKLRREVIKCIGGLSDGGWSAYTVCEGSLYLSLIADLKVHKLLTVSPPMDHSGFPAKLRVPVPVLAIVSLPCRVFNSETEIELVLGINRQIYDMFGDPWAPIWSQFWFDDANYDVMSKFYLQED
jgi:hypothetical protein